LDNTCSLLFFLVRQLFALLLRLLRHLTLPRVQALLLVGIALLRREQARLLLLLRLCGKVLVERDAHIDVLAAAPCGVD